MFLSVLFSLLFSSSFCRRLRRVRRSRPPPTCPRRLCAVFFHFAFFLLGSSSSSWSSWSRERSIQSCDRKERTRHSSPRLLSIFFPFFSAALRIYLSIYLLSLPSVSFVSRRFLLIFMATTDCRVASCCCREGYLNLLAYSSSSSPEYSILLLLVSNCDGGVAHESAAAAADDDDDDAFGLKLGFEI